MDACKSESRSDKVHFRSLFRFYVYMCIRLSCSVVSPRREFIPSLDDFFAEAIEQADPANMVEDEYK